MTNTQTFIKQHPCINDEKIAKNVFWLLTREISNNKSYECTQTLRQVFSEINQEKNVSLALDSFINLMTKKQKKKHEKQNY